MITALTVFGVAHIIQQRQDYENGIERSYRTEMVARVKLAEGVAPKASRRAIVRQEAHRAELRHSISHGTRNTVILVAAGLLAGLVGALLLFAGLIATMRQPLEALVGAAGRLASGDRSTRVEVGGPAETAALGTAFNEMAAELELEASERDRLDRMKDEFVLTASHELRSPLTSVQGFAELLMMDRDSLTPRQVETVQIILDNCRHLVRLLNDLLDLARSDAGRLTIRPRPTQLTPLIEDVVRTMRAQTDADGQTLIERIDPHLPLVEVEPDRIRQILVNLVTNAHEYSPDEATIEVIARVADHVVQIDVIDNGPGIPSAQAEHIFERFVRGDAGLTQRVGGTGLGLAIAKSLVDLHGGTIAVDSVEGRGSTFTVCLPLVAPGAVESTATSGRRALAEGQR